MAHIQVNITGLPAFWIGLNDEVGITRAKNFLPFYYEPMLRVVDAGVTHYYVFSSVSSITWVP